MELDEEVPLELEATEDSLLLEEKTEVEEGASECCDDEATTDAMVELFIFWEVVWSWLKQ